MPRTDPAAPGGCPPELSELPEAAAPRAGRLRRIAAAALVWALAAAFSLPLFAGQAAGAGDSGAVQASAPRVCAAEAVDLRGPAGASRFKVEIADTYESRARGLMHRETMPRDSGMLFLFDPPRPVAFWMRNTILPLDLVFIGPEGKVIRVTRDAVPFSEALMPSGGVVRAVLEVNAGEAARFGITEGDEVRHPAFGKDAAWPCP